MKAIKVKEGKGSNWFCKVTNHMMKGFFKRIYIFYMWFDNFLGTGFLRKRNYSILYMEFVIFFFWNFKKGDENKNILPDCQMKHCEKIDFNANVELYTGRVHKKKVQLYYKEFGKTQVLLCQRKYKCHFALEL